MCRNTQKYSRVLDILSIGGTEYSLTPKNDSSILSSSFVVHFSIPHWNTGVTNTIKRYSKAKDNWTPGTRSTLV